MNKSSFQSSPMRIQVSLCLLFVLTCFQVSFAQVGIGTTTPNASAKLELSSTTQGFLPPRMTSLQRAAIASPAAGLMVYQTDGTEGIYYFNGSSWIYVINASSGTLPVSSGGTGSTTLTSNALLTGNGTGAVGTISVGTSGKVLYSNGTNWVAGSTTASSTGSGTAFSILPPYQTISYCIALQGVFPSAAATDPFIGEIMIFPYNFVPRYWARCDGSLLSIAANSALFSLLGTTFGGNGSTTFGLPDLRGRVVLGEGALNGTGTNYILGASGGSETRTLITTNLPAHTHTITYN